MLSRTADNLYWLARYVERAEYLARILEVTQRLAPVFFLDPRGGVEEPLGLDVHARVRSRVGEAIDPSRHRL